MKKDLNINLVKIVISTIMIILIIGTILFHRSMSSYEGVYLNSKKADETMKNIVTTEFNSNLLDIHQLGDTISEAIFQQENGTYKSYFINVENGNLLKISDLIKMDHYENFKNKIKELVALKFPKFIADSLNYGNGTMTYILKETELIIYFYDFSISPKPQEELTLTVDYHEIKDDVNFPVHLKDEYENENGFNYDPAKKTVALTFDDGPNGSKTLKLVELLTQNKMHATFFMVGNRMASAPNVITEVLKSGNEIGSHSYNHKNLTRLKKEALIEEESSTNTIYKSITGQDLKLLRPPYGNVNNTMKENLNLIFINWNLDTEDWRYRDVDHIYQSVLNNVKDGDIILMHDLYDTTVAAVEKLMPELYVRGFQVVGISELANLKGVTLETHEVYRQIK
jgi:peptidoglycan/xylan/chitin deacetylase (PgdA/CDA1 family)